jgi:hypothetical protein
MRQYIEKTLQKRSIYHYCLSALALAALALALALVSADVKASSNPGEPGASAQVPDLSYGDPGSVAPGSQTVFAKCTPKLSSVDINQLYNQSGYSFHISIDDCGPTDIEARCSFTYQRTDGASNSIYTYYVDSYLSRSGHHCLDIRGVNFLTSGDWKVTTKVYGEINGNASTAKAFTIQNDGSVLTGL